MVLLLVVVLELELVGGLHAGRVGPLELQEGLGPPARLRVQEGADVARVDEPVAGHGAVVVVVAGGGPHGQKGPAVLQRPYPKVQFDS